MEQVRRSSSTPAEQISHFVGDSVTTLPLSGANVSTKRKREEIADSDEEALEDENFGWGSDDELDVEGLFDDPIERPAE